MHAQCCLRGGVAWTLWLLRLQADGLELDSRDGLEQEGPDGTDQGWGGGRGVDAVSCRNTWADGSAWMSQEAHPGESGVRLGVSTVECQPQGEALIFGEERKRDLKNEGGVRAQGHMEAPHDAERLLRRVGPDGQVCPGASPPLANLPATLAPSTDSAAAGACSGCPHHVPDL